MMESLGGRKFVMTLAAMLIGTLTHIFAPRGLTTEFTMMLLGAVATFSGANVFTTIKGPAAAPAAEASDADPVDNEKIEQLAQLTQATAESVDRLSQLILSAMNKKA